MRIRTVVDGFRRRLESLGYTPGTVAYQLVVGRFGRWLSVHCRSVDRIDSADIYAFIADQRRDGRRHGVFRQGLVLLRAYLVDVRAVPADHRRRGMWWVSWSIPICEWLLRERGLAATTVRRYQATARRFLPQRAGGVDLNDLTAAEVSRVPAGTGWHDTGVPPRLSTDRTRSLCWTVATRSTPVGIRNYSPSRPTAWSRSSARWCPGDRDRGDAAVTHTTDQEHLAA